MDTLHKYPKTYHLEGSRRWPTEADDEGVPFAEIAGRHLVVEEKMDGTQVGLGFSASRELMLQSRGHFLHQSGRDPQYNLLKQWATCHQHAFWEVLGTRYVMYGEWLYAKHTIFYDHLPHYFLEFDVLDTHTETFLDTPARQRLLAPLPVHAVAVLHAGPVDSLQALQAMIGPSGFVSQHQMEHLQQACQQARVQHERTLQETDRSGQMEGLYIKVEVDGVVQERYKWIRPAFLDAVLNAGGHWQQRNILPNQLHPNASLFS